MIGYRYNNLNIYDREAAVQYAKKWAMSRNKKYVDFEEYGGDCTNFASQVLYAGGCPMNYHPNGWYYNNINDRAPAWTGVPFFYRFLLNNRSSGPIAVETDIEDVEPGDIIQLNFGLDERYDHTPVIIDIKPGKRSLDKILIAAHSIDRIDYAVSNYDFKKIRFLHILGYKR